MNLFWRELKAHRKSLFFWIVGIAAIVGGGMGEYSAMSGSGGAMNELFADMPRALRAVMGVGELDLATVSGYYGMLFLYLLLMAAVHASMLGANIVSKEERDKTSEFLLVKPISRSGMLASKLLAAVVILLIFNAAMFICSYAFVRYQVGGAEATGDIALLLLGMLLVQFVFMGVGAAIAGATTRPKRAVSLSTGIMLLTFLLSIAIDISGRIDYLRYLTPFKYADAARLMGEGLDIGVAAIALVIIAVSFAIAFAGFKRRDLSL